MTTVVSLFKRHFNLQSDPMSPFQCLRLFFYPLGFVAYFKLILFRLNILADDMWLSSIFVFGVNAE